MRVATRRAGPIEGLQTAAEAEMGIGQVDWAGVAEDVNRHGCALTPRIVSTADCRSLAELYDDASCFRATIDMARYRFGSGQYRYFRAPLPALVMRLRETFYPRLLP